MPGVIAWLVDRGKESVIEDHSMNGTCDSPALERFREARAKMSELDLEIKKGMYVLKDTCDGALSRRAMIFKSDLQNFSRGKATQICEKVHGDRRYLSDLIQFLGDEFEDLLGRYSGAKSDKGRRDFDAEERERVERDRAFHERNDGTDEWKEL